MHATVRGYEQGKARLRKSESLTRRPNRLSVDPRTPKSQASALSITPSS